MYNFHASKGWYVICEALPAPLVLNSWALRSGARGIDRFERFNKMSPSRWKKDQANFKVEKWAVYFCHWSIQKPVQKQNTEDKRSVESAWCSTEEEERGRVCRVYCSDLGPSFFQFEQKQRKHWLTNTHFPGVRLPFLNTSSPCTHTETNQKATAGCKRSPGVKSMAVKPKVINNGTGRDVHTAGEDE